MGYTENVLHLRRHYTEAIRLYGDRPEGAQWSSLETQEKRFEILLEMADVNGYSVLDFGCGTAALHSYMEKKRLVPSRYIGCDIVEEALKIAQGKYPQDFYMTPEIFFSSDYCADYSFISGVFNNKLYGDDNRAYYQRLLPQVWERTRRGLAFNMMSIYVDFYNEELFYEKPEEVFSFVKKNLSSYIVLRNDYQIKKGVVPFEFTVYVYRTMNESGMARI